jgi:hypothetical protein
MKLMTIRKYDFENDGETIYGVALTEMRWIPESLAYIERKMGIKSGETDKSKAVKALSKTLAKGSKTSKPVKRKQDTEQTKKKTSVSKKIKSD